MADFPDTGWPGNVVCLLRGRFSDGRRRPSLRRGEPPDKRPDERAADDEECQLMSC